MSSILRGLLQSPASTTLAGDGPTGSVETPRLHRQHCIDQWDSIKKEDYQTECTNNGNSICNIKMEENIDQEQFWRHCSAEEETKDKSDETTESTEGFYYTYITEATRGWSNQEWAGEHVPPTQLQSPHSDIKSQYFLGKAKSKRSLKMNTYPLSPLAFAPNLVPDLTQDDFLASCFGSGFGYDGSPSFKDSLLTPPDTLGFPKLLGPSAGGGDDGLSLSDCGGVFDTSYNELNLDSDWLNEPINLHTPDSQDGDITLTTSTPYTTLVDLPSPYADVTLPVTPGTSHPPTPLSTSPSSDVEEVLSLFSDQSSNDSSRYLPSEYLPFGASLGSFDSTPDSSQYNSPALSPVNSPYTSQDVSYYTPQDLPSSPFEATQLPSSNLLADRKRKASESTAPKTKRRLSLSAKKERKKEQNKTAALRYRQKKKVEKSGCFSKVDDLEAKNAALKKTVNTITAEINYLKKLWSEVSAAKSVKQGQTLC